MFKSIAGALVWSIGAVSASAAPMGLRLLSGSEGDSAVSLAAVVEAASAHPMWGLAIATFGVLGSWLREKRKQRAALAYR